MGLLFHILKLKNYLLHPCLSVIPDSASLKDLEGLFKNVKTTLESSLGVKWVAMAIEGGVLKIYLSLSVGVPIWKKEELFTSFLSPLGLNLISVDRWGRSIPTKFLSLLVEGKGHISGISLLALLREVGGKGRSHEDFFLTFKSPNPTLRSDIKEVLLRFLNGPIKFCIGRSKGGDEYFVSLTLEGGLKSSSFWLFKVIFKGRLVLGPPVVKCVKGSRGYREYIKKNSVPSSFISYERGL